MNAATPRSAPADILVVDDTHANLQLLAGMLKERGYKVRPALNGESALRAARTAAPDLILLDINMPGLSGYDVATQLKQDEALRDIPILFLSALSETLDKVRAFNAGGVDYITKPFQFEEVAARVETHLKIRRLQIELEQRNRDLEQRNEELRQLQELRDNLTHMIVHDLRNPLAGVMGYLELFQMVESKGISASGTEHLRQASTSARRLLDIVNSLLDVSKMEAGQLKLHRTDCDLGAVVHEILAALESVRTKRTFAFDAPAAPVMVSADRDLLLRVVQNLVGNALKFAPEGTSVRINIQATAGGIRMSVADAGCGIAPEHHARIFTKFGQVASDGPRVGTGLGLTFCKLAIETHGGQIGVNSEVGRGSTFWFEIPTTGETAPKSAT